MPRIAGNTAFSGLPLSMTKRLTSPVVLSRKTTPGDDMRRRTPAVWLDVLMD